MGGRMGWAAVAMAVLAGPAAAGPVTVLDRGHYDVEVAYEGGELEVHVHLHDTDTVFSPANALLKVNVSPASQFTVPNGQYPLLGPAGTQAFVLPQANPEPEPVLWLGIASAEEPGETLAGTFAEPAVLRFLGADGPGRFSVWQDGLFGPTALVTDGVGEVLLDHEQHDHFNWGFTAPGLYRVTVRAEATFLPNLGGERVTTEDVVLTFQVGEAAVVPEPASAALFAVGGLAAVGLRRVRRRR